MNDVRLNNGQLLGIMTSMLVLVFLIVGFSVLVEEKPPAPAESDPVPFERRPVMPETASYEWSETLSVVAMQPELVEALDNEHVWATDSGTIYFYDGSAWTRQLSTGLNLNCISAAGENVVWASGVDNKTGVGFIYFFNGSAWAEQFRSPKGLRDVCAIGPSRAWAMGESPFFFDGTTWIAKTAPPGAALAMSAAGEDMVWACGDGTCWFYDGTSWTTQLQLETRISDICAIGSGQAWLVSSGDPINEEDTSTPNSRIYFFDGREWKLQYETTESVGSLSASTRDNAWAWFEVDSHGPLTLLHYDGREWRDYTPPDIANVTCISPLGRNQVWLTGGFG